MTNGELKKAKKICEKEKHISQFMGISTDFAFSALDGWPVALEEIEKLKQENAKLKQALAECAGY